MRRGELARLHLTTPDLFLLKHMRPLRDPLLRYLLGLTEFRLLDDDRRRAGVAGAVGVHVSAIA